MDQFALCSTYTPSCLWVSDPLLIFKIFSKSLSLNVFVVKSPYGLQHSVFTPNISSYYWFETLHIIYLKPFCRERVQKRKERKGTWLVLVTSSDPLYWYDWSSLLARNNGRTPRETVLQTPSCGGSVACVLTLAEPHFLYRNWRKSQF